MAVARVRRGKAGPGVPVGARTGEAPGHVGEGERCRSTSVRRREVGSRRRWAGGTAIAGALAILVPAVAHAQHPIYAQLAGGLAIFPGESRFDTGAAFGVAAGWRGVRPLAIEAGYQGAVFTEAEQAGRAAIAVVEHGGYLALLGVPFDFEVAPYALVGVEVSHRRTAGEVQEPSVRPGTFVRLPLGAGADWRLGLFSLGLRGVYDLSLRERREGGAGRAGDRIDVTLRIGASF